ncbi:hypothetical protein H0H92_002593 [Tricholoma furcatifolium]|nr:hypothetical protein H0H92_002593 [Tricholoma furcatifolium]
MWSLTSQRTVLLTKTIHAPPETVLALVQDPNVLFAASPLITNVTPDSSDSSNTYYTITDNLSFGGLFNFQIKYKCRLVKVVDGINSEVAAGFGTRLKGQSRVKAGEDGSTELSEETVIETTFFMMPYVLKSFTAAHTSALEVLAARAEKLLSVIIAGILSTLYFSKTSNDPYGLFHLSFNQVGPDTHSPPKTEWLNMGYWKVTLYVVLGKIAILSTQCRHNRLIESLHLIQAYLKLAPEGRIALADICFATTAARRSWAGWLLVSLFGLMPRQNIVSVEEYVAQMRKIGYEEVELEDITEHVFPGFVQFLKGRGAGWRAFGSIMDWYYKAGARFVIVSGSHQK